MSDIELKDVMTATNNLNTVIKAVQDESKANKTETGEQKEKLARMEADFTEKLEVLDAIKKSQDELKTLNNRALSGDIDLERKELMQKESAQFKDFLQKGDNRSSYTNYIERKDLSTLVQEEGGYLTGTQFGGIIESNKAEVSNIAADCQTLTLNGQSNSVEYPIDDDTITQPTSVQEGAGTSTTVTENLSYTELKPYNLMRKVKLTTNMLNDGIINIEQWIGLKVAKGFALKEENLIFSGTGSGEAKGILTYTADASTAYGAYTRDRIQVQSSGHASDINNDTGLDSLIEMLKPSYYGKAKLYMHSTTAFRLLRLKDGDSRPLIDPAYSKNPATSLTYRGFPISIQQGMPVIAANVLAIAFGDMSEAYTVVRKQGFQVIKDIYTDDNNVTIKTTQRFGGAVVNFEAVKLMKVEA